MALIASMLAAPSGATTIFAYQPGAYAVPNEELFDATGIDDPDFAALGLPDFTRPFASGNLLPPEGSDLFIGTPTGQDRPRFDADPPLSGDYFSFFVTYPIQNVFIPPTRFVQLEVRDPNGDLIVPVIESSILRFDRDLPTSRNVALAEEAQEPGATCSTSGFGFGFGGGSPCFSGGTGVSAGIPDDPDQTDQCGFGNAPCALAGSFIIPDMEIGSIELIFPDGTPYSGVPFMRGDFELREFSDDVADYYAGILATDPAVIPLPAGIWLLLSGVAGLAFVRRHQSSNSAARA
ncbi:MAG: VPLPA-CTERM sorting domain-containing protein [Pseudomonadota bacterium]